MKFKTKQTLEEIGFFFFSWFGLVTAIATGIVLSEYLKLLIMILFIL